MKIVINNDYGGYGLLNWDDDDQYSDIVEKYKHDRTNPVLVAVVENNHIGDLAVVEIPDEATDWDIKEYDGLETVIYVLNGKIYYAENPYETEKDDDEESDGE